MFKSNRLIYQNLGAEKIPSSPERESIRSDIASEYKPKRIDTRYENEQREKDLQQCEDLETKIEQANFLKEVFNGTIDGLFINYKRDCLGQDNTEKLAKKESDVSHFIKKQFDEWFSSLDLCEVSLLEVEDTIVRYYKGLIATVNVWKVYEESNNLANLDVATGYAYDKAMEFAKKAPIGSGKIVMIDPWAYSGWSKLAGGSTDRLIMDQKSPDWAQDSNGKIKYLRDRFGEIAKTFDFEGIGYWNTQNRNEYVDKVIHAIASHPNSKKMDAYTTLKVLSKFAEQTKYYTEIENYNAIGAIVAEMA